ncbi:hybrid sensor histidine kinase/response regulator [Burkholderia sp. LMG 21824]|uniref:hybrid sensor histidine kinase/response regulator n=1 Tax=Burkholderia sp. LMG 21824 TaxID=3158172 RepID=UPI003C2F13DD
MRKLASRIARSPAFILFLSLALSIWLIVLTQTTHDESLIELAGPTENYYWGVAQFRIFTDDLESATLKYAYTNKESFDDVEMKYELLQSKILLISTVSDTTKSAFSEKLYQITIPKINERLKLLGQNIQNLPITKNDPGKVLEDLYFLKSCYLDLLHAIGPAEMKRRDALLRDLRAKRQFLFACSIIVALLLGLTILSLLLTLRRSQSLISIEKNARAAEAAATDAVKKTAHTKQIFLGAISHELRNPLQTLVSSLDNLSHRPLDSESMEILLSMEGAISHLEMHMHDLNDYIRLDTGKLNLTFDEIEVLPMLNDIRKRYSNALTSKQLTLQVMAHPRDLKIQSDRKRLQQIINNLTENSIKFSENGTIVIEIKNELREGIEFTIIRVSDQGRGIPSDKLDQLFDPFFQISQYQKIPSSGYGMGLAIVKGIVELLGGNISVESQVGIKTIFTIALPSQAIRNPSDGQCDTNNNESIAAARILLIDDQKDVLDSLSKSLSALGVDVDTCDGAEQGYVLVNSNNYDIIFVDVHMPNVNGIDFSKAIRKKFTPKNPPPLIIAISAYDPDYLHEDDATVFDAFLTKPIGPKIIRRLVYDFLLNRNN